MAELSSKQPISTTTQPAALAHSAQRWGPLLAILILATGLRLWGLHFGLPYFEHPDEWAVADEALRMLRTGNFEPLSFTYPTLYVYAQVAMAWLHYTWGALTGRYSDPGAIDPASFYLWARALTASLGVGLVGLSYAVGRRMAGTAAGLGAAFLLAILPTAIGDAHYVTVDTPAAFFGMLAFWLITRLAPPETTPRPWPIFLAGLVVGMAASTKYNVGVMVAPLGAVLLMRAIEQRSWVSLLREGGIAACGVFCGFTLGTPLWLVQADRLIDDLAGIARHYRETGHPGAESSRPWLFYFGALSFEATALAWASLIGALVALTRRKPLDWLILALAIPYVIQLSSVRVVFFRNAVPLLPFVCLLAALAVVVLTTWVVQRFKRQTIGPLLLLISFGLIGWQPLAKATRDEWLRVQPTTRMLATEWINANAPVGSRIWLEDQTLILASRFRVQGGKPLTSNSPEWYREQGFRFLVINASIAKSDPQQLIAFGQPAASFAADGQRYGHTFVIYDTGVGDLSKEQRSPSGATLAGGLIVLEGFRHPGIVQAGGVLPLALYWQANGVIDRDYVVFVHLLDANEAKLAQRDLQPLEGSRPTSSWQVGELLRDDQDLAIPAGTPPGRYRLVVGMYDAITFAAITDQGPITIGDVVVE
ncbi:MAG: hypothetical protein Fur005_17390 [Roseiflexaceae bacterium]